MKEMMDHASRLVRLLKRIIKVLKTRLRRVVRELATNRSSFELSASAQRLFQTCPPLGWCELPLDVLTRFANEAGGSIVYLGSGTREEHEVLGEFLHALKRSCAQGYRCDSEFFLLTVDPETRVFRFSSASRGTNSKLLAEGELRSVLSQVSAILSSQPNPSGLAQPASLLINVKDSGIVDDVLQVLRLEGLLKVGSLICIYNAYGSKQDEKDEISTDLLSVVQFCQSGTMLIMLVVAARLGRQLLVRLAKNGMAVYPQLVLNALSHTN